MDLELSSQHKAFKAEVKAFLSTKEKEFLVRDRGAASLPENFSFQKWQVTLIEQGYAARTIPQEYGGYGAEPDVMNARILAEEFANSPLPGPMANQGISMLVPTLLECGSEAQKKQWIEPTIKGEVVWCQGYSEPGSGSDLASLRTKGELIDDSWVINGQKIWTSTAHQAQMMFCLVRTEPDAPKHLGISYLLIPMDTPGIEVRPLVSMTGHAEFNEVFFTDVTIPASNIVGQRGEGWQVANATLKHERGMLGDPDSTLKQFNALADLLRTESNENGKLMDDPVLRDRLLKLHGELLAMRYNGMRLATDDGGETLMARLCVKLMGCELNHQISRLAIDALEELGTLYQEGEHLRNNGRWQWNYMYQLGLIIGGGTAQIQKNIIGERGLGMPREMKPPPKESVSDKAREAVR